MAGTIKGEATRRRIAEAAWTLSERKGVEALLGGVTLRELAAEAGLSPSAVTYHFPTMSDVGVAMLETLEEDDSALPIELVDELLRTAQNDGLAAATHAAAMVNWFGLTTPGQVSLERRILRAIAVASVDGSVRPIVNAVLERWTESLCTIYERTLEASDRQLVEPFTLVEVTETIESMAGGLLHLWMIDPDRIRPDLAADMIVGLLSVVTSPTQSPTALAEISATLDPDRFLVDDTEPAIAERAAPLFVDGFQSVTLTQIAAHLEVELDELTSWAGSGRRVAALSFARHVPRIREAIERRPSAGAEVVLADAVYELARVVVSDPHCALALLQERQSAAADPTGVGSDVRVLVPLDQVLGEPVHELISVPGEAAANGHVDLMVDTVLGIGATRPRTPPAEITSVAMRLLPDF